MGQRSVQRYKVIVVEYLDQKFKRKKQVFRDFEAQIIQHETDHFNGILIKEKSYGIVEMQHALLAATFFQS